MIESVVSSLSVIFGVLLGEYLCSLVLGSLKGAKQAVSEIVIFLVLINLFLFNIVVADNLIVRLFVYFITAFVSIISSRTIVYLIFNASPVKFLFEKSELNPGLIKLAKSLSKRMSKSEVIELFRKAGFGSSLIKHLEAVLSEL